MLAHEFTRERYSTCVTGSSKSSHAEETLGLKGPTCHVSVVSFFIQASVYDLEVSNIRNMDICKYVLECVVYIDICEYVLEYVVYIDSTPFLWHTVKILYFLSFTVI